MGFTASKLTTIYAVYAGYGSDPRVYSATGRMTASTFILDGRGGLPFGCRARIPIGEICRTPGDAVGAYHSQLLAKRQTHSDEVARINALLAKVIDPRKIEVDR